MHQHWCRWAEGPNKPTLEQLVRCWAVVAPARPHLLPQWFLWERGWQECRRSQHLWELEAELQAGRRDTETEDLRQLSLLLAGHPRGEKWMGHRKKLSEE